ncbi:MAG: hypothetical protein HQ557_07880 [Bacteroidetes bacterium]|nr:hypothetical protein [Bacteroidota bacterium]
MTKDNDSRNRVTKRIRWIARIWGILILAYALAMFIGYAGNWITTGTADPYAVEGYPPIEVLPPIFMFLSALGLGIAWRWERLGGIITLVFQLAVLFLLLMNNPITHNFPRSAIPYLMSLIIAAPGVLFLVYWWRSKKRGVPNDSA